MDRVTESLFKSFVESENLSAYQESDAFERFANYAVMSRDVSESFNVDEVSTGGGEDTGIDGVAVLVNGSLVSEKEDVDSLVASNKYLDVSFIMVQAKTSDNFSAAEIGSFCFGVKDLFNRQPKLKRNEPIKDAAVLADHIYTRSNMMTRRKPDLYMYYVTTGKWVGDPMLKARIESEVADLRDTGLFHDVIFTPVDAQRLQDYYRQNTNKVSAEFAFGTRVPLPEMDGVKEAHLGVIQAKEFLPLITDASGNIRKSLFYDNVRDFQDYNDVNKDIRATLQSAQREHFVLLNNGVTLIASSLRVVGNKITIEDYQVVNGCQTCHVIFDCRALIGDDVYVPIKVIATDDELLTSAIIKGTNRQTQVKTAQLYALTEFQKRLETYFNTFKGPQALYYERRSKQHSGSSVEKVRIVSIQQEMRCFAAMFLDEAHRGHYPRSLQPYVGTKLFNEKHRLEPYYVSAYSQYRLEYFFRSSQLPAGLKPARYHLLMVARHLASGPRLPSMHSNKMGRKCEKLMETFWDDAKALALFKRAATVIDKAVSKRPLNRELTKTQPFTEDVLKAL